MSRRRWLTVAAICFAVAGGLAALRARSVSRRMSWWEQDNTGPPLLAPRPPPPNVRQRNCDSGERLRHTLAAMPALSPADWDIVGRFLDAPDTVDTAAVWRVAGRVEAPLQAVLDAPLCARASPAPIDTDGRLPGDVPPLVELFAAFHAWSGDGDAALRWCLDLWLLGVDVAAVGPLDRVQAGLDVARAAAACSLEVVAEAPVSPLGLERGGLEIGFLRERAPQPEEIVRRERHHQTRRVLRAEDTPAHKVARLDATEPSWAALTEAFGLEPARDGEAAIRSAAPPDGPRPVEAWLAAWRTAYALDVESRAALTVVAARTHPAGPCPLRLDTPHDPVAGGRIAWDADACRLAWGTGDVVIRPRPPGRRVVAPRGGRGAPTPGR